MKKIILIAFSLLIVSCVFKTKGKDGNDGKDGKPSKSITITSTEVKDAVTYLASDELKGRQSGTADIDKAAAYIEKQFKSNNVKPYFETYRDDFKVKDSLDAFNVVGYIEGSDPKLKNEIILIGAHYDHIGKAKLVEGDSIANGANDNATGTVAVLSIAKYFAAKNNNKRSLVFALFSAEEMGLLGSKHLAKKLKTQNIDLYALVNFEMIGVPFKDRDYEAFLTGFELSNMADKINDYLGNKLIGFSEVSKKYNLFKRSDNYPFYNEFKVPSHTISACDLTNFNYYHHIDDEVKELDFDFMANLINKTIPALEAMANTATKEIVMTNGN